MAVGRRSCQICALIVEGETFQNSNHSRSFTISSGAYHCNSENVVYLLQCDCCNKKCPLIRDLGLRVSRAYFNGLRAPKDKIAVLQGSILCSSGLQGLYFLKFKKTAMGMVWAPGLLISKLSK